MEFKIIPVSEEHLDALTTLCALCFSHPWTWQGLAAELESDTAYFRVLVAQSQGNHENSGKVDDSPQGQIPGQALGLSQVSPFRRIEDSPQGRALGLSQVSPFRRIEDSPQGQALGLTLMHCICGECYIDLVAVHPDFRQLGLGSMLVKNMIQHAQNIGAAFLTLEVRESNAAAIALYTGLGFRQVGKRPKFYSDGETALLLTLEMAEQGMVPPDAQIDT